MTDPHKYTPEPSTHLKQWTQVDDVDDEKCKLFGSYPITNSWEVLTRGGMRKGHSSLWIFAKIPGRGSKLFRQNLKVVLHSGSYCIFFLFTSFSKNLLGGPPVSSPLPPNPPDGLARNKINYNITNQRKAFLYKQKIQRLSLFYSQWNILFH